MKIVLWGKIIYFVVAISSFCFCFFHLINTMEMHFEIILSKCVVISKSKPSSFCGCFGFDKQTKIWSMKQLLFFIFWRNRIPAKRIKTLLKPMEKSKDNFSLDQIVCSQTGHMAGIRTKCMVVYLWILIYVGSGENINETMFLVALMCSAHSWEKWLVSSWCSICKCGLKCFK